ncbi:MAG: VirB3 family type IV secretion system protein [Myxococcales bacterium]|nr:VirB3 family type IV secretion system protein [Myxococcales bacterium]
MAVRDGETLEGFTVPIHTALTQPLLIMGVPRSSCFVLWTIGCAFAFGMQEVWVLPITLAAHLVLMKLTEIDSHYFTVLGNELRAPRRLEP